MTSPYCSTALDPREDLLLAEGASGDKDDDDRSDEDSTSLVLPVLISTLLPSRPDCSARAAGSG